MCSKSNCYSLNQHRIISCVKNNFQMLSFKALSNTCFRCYLQQVRNWNEFFLLSKFESEKVFNLNFFNYFTGIVLINRFITSWLASLIKPFSLHYTFISSIVQTPTRAIILKKFFWYPYLIEWSYRSCKIMNFFTFALLLRIYTTLTHFSTRLNTKGLSTRYIISKKAEKHSEQFNKVMSYDDRLTIFFFLSHSVHI